MKKILLVFLIILGSLTLIEQHLINQGLPESWIKIYKRCYQSCLENCQNKKFCNRYCTFRTDEEYYRKIGIKIKE
ncbi:hypothetical protein J7K44_02305 [bacterium]|nr:hypothetical protein [bacterium]